MGYTSFRSEEDSQPVASSSRQPYPTPASSESEPAPPTPGEATMPKKRRRSSPNPVQATEIKSSKASGSAGPRTVSYHASDDELEAAEAGAPATKLSRKASKQQLKLKRRKSRDGLVKGALAPGEATSAEKLRDEKQRLMATRQDLPIWAGQAAIVKAVAENDTCVILGETGSGKTTQVPQFILSIPELMPKRIAITQPRRVAAITLAERVASEQGTLVGGRVGHSVRFDKKVSPATSLLYMTDGMLVRDLLTDAHLSRYGAVVIDEAHERNIATDILLGSLKRIQAARKAGSALDADGKPLPPLKIIIMSATLDAERFSTFFNSCPVLYVRGRQHVVKLFHAEKPIEDYYEAAIRVIFQLHSGKSGDGDILVFLSGQDDIESIAEQVKSLSMELPPSHPKLLVLPFMAATLATQSAQVFQPAPPKMRKLILATNVAETSITIPGVKFVIDSGFHKEKTYISKGHSGVESLALTRISQSAARQRQGRAGREGPGFCFRLYTAAEYNTFADAPLPEILRSNLAQTVLQLKDMGVDDISGFPMLDRPSPDLVTESLMTLVALGALNPSTAQITPLGHRMLQYPLDPMHARVVLASITHGCVRPVLDVLALLSESPIFTPEPPSERELAAEARESFRHRLGDHLTMLNVLRSYEELDRSGADARAKRDWCRSRFVNERNLKKAVRARDQMREICERDNVDWESSGAEGGEDVDDLVLKSLVEGMFFRTALLREGAEYRALVGNSIVKIHPSSSLHNKRHPVILFDEIVHTSSTYARCVSSIQYSWLAENLAFNQRSA